MTHLTQLAKFVHEYAVVLIACWAAFSLVLSSLPTPEAFATYYEMPKCPRWYKTAYAIGHFVSMNWARVVPQLRLFSKDK